MNFIIDNNGEPILDENNNKIEYSVKYIYTDDWYTHKEAIHINEDNNLDTEDRYLIVKEASQANQAVC